MTDAPPPPEVRFGRRPAALAAFAVLLSLPAVAGTAAAQQAAPSGDEAAPRLAGQLHAALASGDSARVLELLHEEVRVYESGHAETRAEYRAGHLGADIEFARGTEREVLSERVRSAGDGMALYLAEYRTTGTFRGEQVDSRGTETLVVERGSDGWRIVHIHWSSR